SRERRVWVSIFWLTPANVRASSEYRKGRGPPPLPTVDPWEPPPPSAHRTRTTHLSEIRSRSCLLGQAARNASNWALAAARRCAAVLVAIQASPHRRVLRTATCPLPDRE